MGGIGEWSMHFVGMVALRLDVASSYGIVESAVSLVAAVVCTSAAHVVVSKAPRDPARILGAGLCWAWVWRACTTWACTA